MALAFILETDQMRERFLSLSGLSGADLRTMAPEAAFQIGVLDFLLGHEPDLLAFAQARNLAPESIAVARYQLDNTRPLQS